jgi:hypothetical protein
MFWLDISQPFKGVEKENFHSFAKPKGETMCARKSKIPSAYFCEKG